MKNSPSRKMDLKKFAFAVLGTFLPGVQMARREIREALEQEAALKAEHEARITPEQRAAIRYAFALEHAEKKGSPAASSSLDRE